MAFGEALFDVSSLDAVDGVQHPRQGWLAATPRSCSLSNGGSTTSPVVRDVIAILWSVDADDIEDINDVSEPLPACFGLHPGNTSGRGDLSASLSAVS